LERQTTMLDMAQFDGSVKDPSCEEPRDDLGTAPKQHPKKLVLVWRGKGAPTVADWLCWDAAAAYMHAEHMAGLRDGDTVILYSLNWQADWAGRA
jgi:hypothetical protein